MHNENLLAQPIPSSIKRPPKHLSSIHDQEMEDMEVWLLIPVEWIGWIGHGFWLLALPLVISWGTLENLPYLGVKNATQVISGMVIGFTTCYSNCYPLSPRAHTHTCLRDAVQGYFWIVPGMFFVSSQDRIPFSGEMVSSLRMSPSQADVAARSISIDRIIVFVYPSIYLYVQYYMFLYNIIQSYTYWWLKIVIGLVICYVQSTIQRTIHYFLFVVDSHSWSWILGNTTYFDIILLYILFIVIIWTCCNLILTSRKSRASPVISGITKYYNPLEQRQKPRCELVLLVCLWFIPIQITYNIM